MIFLKLFLTFLKIGATTFGGGYAMIPIMREAALSNGWLTEGELLNFIAVAESTPGPGAINMATFVGASQGALTPLGALGRVLGAASATLGVVLPSFIIILIIAAFIRKFLEYKGVNAALKGIRPVVVGLIIATALSLGLSLFLGIDNASPASLSLSWPSLILFLVLCGIAFGYKKWKGKAISPIFLILLSGIFGVIFFL